MKRMVSLLKNPSMVFYIICDKIAAFFMGRKKNVYFGRSVRVSGVPIIDIRHGSKLYVGDGVTLNSRNRGYHINMHSPVKLFADRDGAEIKIGNKTRIHGTCVHAYESITIGSNCLIAANCQIMDGSGHDLSFPNTENRINTTGATKPIIIEDNVWVGANSVILPGVTIGKGSIISANSVVTKSIPPSVVAGGNPAVIIKDFSSAV